MSRSDYPDHLNPFSDPPKKGLGISSSFKDFGKTIRQSFRIKNKKAKTESRRGSFFPTPVVTVRPSYSYHESNDSTSNNSTPALPRSRFRERLTKSYQEVNQVPLICNPFEEENSASTGGVGEGGSEGGGEGEKKFHNQNDDTKPVIRPRRKKRRAPMPPKLADYLDGRADSKWSLSSVGTDASFDYSSDYGSTAEVNHLNEISEMSQELQNLTREMEMLNDDSNNNVVKTGGESETETETKADYCDKEKEVPEPGIEEGDEVPEPGLDLRDDESASIEVPEDDRSRPGSRSTDLIITVTDTDTITNTNTINLESRKELETETRALDNISISNSSVEDLQVVDISNNLQKIERKDIDIIESNNILAQDISITTSSSSSSNIKTSTNNNNNTATENATNNNKTATNPDNSQESLTDFKSCESIKDLPLNYNEHKSIYIYNSKDNLLHSSQDDVYSEKVSLYIEGSQDELNTSDYENVPKEKEDSTAENPVPKLRKNKLTKSALLGRETLIM